VGDRVRSVRGLSQAGGSGRPMVIRPGQMKLPPLVKRFIALI
jgi:hypothetical protein